MTMTDRETLERALSALVRTRRCMQLYPVANPVVRAALQQLHEALKMPPSLDPISASKPLPPLTCEIRGDGFYFDGEESPMGAGRPELKAFAQLLYGAGAKLLYFQPGLPLKAATAFVSGIMALERGTPPENIPELSQPRVGLAFVEESPFAETNEAPFPETETETGDLLAHLLAQRATGGEFAKDPEAASRQHMGDVLAFFLAVEAGDDRYRSQLEHTLSDPGRLAETYSYVGHMPAAGPHGHGEKPRDSGHQSRDALRQTLRHMAQSLQDMPADLRAFALANMAEAVVTTDADTRTCLIEEVLPLGIGQEGIEDALTRQLPPGTASRVLLRHIRVHAGTASTLQAFLEGMENPRQRGQVAAGLLGALRAEGEAPSPRDLIDVLENAGSGMRNAAAAPSLLDGEQIAADIRRRMSLAEAALHVTHDEVRALRRSVAAADEVSDAQQDALSYFHVFAIGSYAEREQHMLARLQDALCAAIARKDFHFVNHVVQLALGLVRSDVREDAYPTLLPYLEALHQDPNFTKFLTHLTEMAESEEAARTTINTLAGDTAPAVFSALAQEEVKSRRFALLNLLLSMGPGILGYLQEQINHPQWYVVRNAVYLLGRVPAQANLRVLERALRHRDLRVRQEALSSLQLYDPRETAPLIAKALHDPEEYLRARAAQLLMESGQTPYAVDLIDILRKHGGALRRQPEFALAVVRALGVLCNGASMGELERLRRQTWLPGTRKRSELRAACAESLAAIQARGGVPARENA